MTEYDAAAAPRQRNRTQKNPPGTYAAVPLTNDEILDLADQTPVTGTFMLARCLHVSEPTARQAAKDGTIAAMGIRVLVIGGAHRKFPTADIVKALGIERRPKLAADSADLSTAG